MKRKLLAVLLGGVFSAGVLAQPSWLSDADTTIEQARKAKRNDVPAASATTEMINLGRDPAQVVQAVVQTYGDCEALRGSVRTGASLAPLDAQAMVEAVNVLPCFCTADSVWPDMRLESRIRPETRRLSVSVAAGSACAAAAAQAAVTGAPAQASDIFRASMGQTRGGSVLDSVGQVGANPPMVEQQQLLSRDTQKSAACSADLRIDDEFNPSERFAAQPGAGDVVVHQSRCDNAMDLMIDGVASAMTQNTAVVLRNDTDDLIDLSRGGYVVEVYFAGSDKPGRRIALEGTINPGGNFVIASPNATPEVRSAANLLTPSVRVSPGDSVVLRRGATVSDCRGISTAMATIANTLGEQGGDRWVQELRNEYESGQTLRAVDAIGQAGVGEDAWQGAMAGQPMTLRRQNDSCEGDANPADAFSVSGGWQAAEGVVPADLGSTSSRCSAPSADIVISQYATGGAEYRAVELLNNTSGDVDLGRDGYVMEIYADGATEPTRTVALEGSLPVGQALVVTNSNAPAEVRERSQMVTADLDLERINAIVLRKTGIVAGRACASEVIAVTRDLGPIPVALTLGNPIVPSREPSNDDVLVGRGSGGELASPN